MASAVVVVVDVNLYCNNPDCTSNLELPVKKKTKSNQLPTVRYPLRRVSKPIDMMSSVDYHAA